EDEVVVEAVGDRRAEAERRARTDLEHRLREHVREAVADAVQVLFFVPIHGVFHLSVSEPSKKGREYGSTCWRAPTRARPSSAALPTGRRFLSPASGRARNRSARHPGVRGDFSAARFAWNGIEFPGGRITLRLMSSRAMNFNP